MHTVRKRIVAHLVASPFLGGPERQMLGLADALPNTYESAFLCYMEGGKGQALLDAARAAGHSAIALKHNFPHLLRSAREVWRHLETMNADVLLTHNYKPNMVGFLAARRCRIPIIAVSRGWTWATARVRFYERLDRLLLRFMDRVVCVSAGQARKVRKAGVSDARILVIRNAIDASRFDIPSPDGAAELRALFTRPMPHIVLAIGRLSPEKGFDDLIKAAATVCARRHDVGFVLIGDGSLRYDLLRQAQAAGLTDRFVFAGFRKDIDILLPHATLLAQSSLTEGMPNVVLEAMAASVPVVATAVGGTPEVVDAPNTGLLVPPRDPQALARGILDVLGDSVGRAEMARAGRRRIERQFTFASQASTYAQLL